MHDRPLRISDDWPANAVACGLLFLLAFCVFSAGFGSDLVFDGRVIVGDDLRLKQFTQANIAKIFTENYWWPTMQSNAYRPVTTLSFAFDYSVLGFEKRAFGYQLINLVLHACAGSLAFLLLRRMGVVLGGAWLAAAWFVAHPFVAEVVPNVVGRADILAMLAMLAGLHFYLKVLWAECSPVKALWLFLLVGLLGVLAKESAASLVALVIWHAMTLGRARMLILWRAGVLRRNHFVFVGVVFGLIAMALVAPKMVFREQSFDADLIVADNPLRALDWFDARLNALAIFARNLICCIVPFEVSSDYSYNQIPLAFWPIGNASDCLAVLWAAGGLLFGLLGLACAPRRPAIAFAIGAVFITLLPTANLVILIGTIRADRLIYPAIIPMVVALGLLLRELYDVSLKLGAMDGRVRLFGRMASIAGGGAALGALALFTHFRCTEWRTTKQFWASAFSTSPDSFKTKAGWAVVLSREGDLASADEAVRLAGEAVRQVEAATDVKAGENGRLRPLNQLYGLIYVERGRLHRDNGRMDLAAEDFARGEQILSALVADLANLNAKLFLEARAAGNAIPSSNADMTIPAVTVADLLRARGKPSEAAALLERHLQYNRLLPEYLQALGRAWVDSGDWEKGVRYLLDASVIKPTEKVYSGEAAWVWRMHALPHSASPFATQKIKEEAPPLPVIDLNDPVLAQQTEDAARRIAAVLGEAGLDSERLAFVRQIRFKVGLPSWLR